MHRHYDQKISSQIICNIVNRICDMKNNIENAVTDLDNYR